MAKAKVSEDTMVNVSIPKIETRIAEVRLIGDSPLIVHKWSEKAKKEILDKQMKKATKGREVKVPLRDYVDSMYWLTEMPDELKNMDENTPQEIVDKAVAQAKFGFPTCAFKACAIDAGFQQKILEKKTTARGAFHIMDEFAVIEGIPNIREDMVRVGMGTADIRYRGEFQHWATTLKIKYNATAISLEQIIQLLDVGGFANGVGEWRPSKDGAFGTFHVAKENE